MNISQFHNLTGKMLIASPFAMKGMLYHQSLIYVIHHSENGAIGFIFNHAACDIPVNSIFKGYNIQSAKNIGIHIGGPMDVQHGFFLHSDDYQRNVLVSDNQSKLCISSNTQILEDIMQGAGPAKSMFIIGYTAWIKGQMEDEIRNNLWIVDEPSQELIFNSKNAESWSNALRVAGVSSDFFIPTYKVVKN